MKQDAGSIARGRALAAFRAAHALKKVRAGGGDWEYIACGRQDGPALLLLPGAPGRADTAFEHIAAFEGEYRVVAPNYPAFPRTVADVIEGIAAMLDAERIASAAVVGGSYSGLIAQVLVRRYPGRVSKLVLSDTGVPARGRARKHRLYLRLLHVLPSWAISALWRLGSFLYLREIESDRAFWRAYFRALGASLRREDYASRLRVWVDFDLHYRFEPDDLCAWPGSILVLEASHDNTFSPEERARLKRLYPQARVRTFRGGHAASLSRRGEYIEAIAAFLVEGNERQEAVS